jgi:predicted nucleic acid-binding protein
LARYVVDASVVLALVLQEGYDQVDTFFKVANLERDVLLAPQLLLPECTSVIRRYVFRGSLSPSDGEAHLREVLELNIRTTFHSGQFSRALPLAERTNVRKGYDLQYLACAQVEDATLITIDGGLRQAAINIKHPVRFLR